MSVMTENASQHSFDPRKVRALADDFVSRAAELDPILATSLGLPIRQDQLPDLSPAGQEAKDELQRATLLQLTEVEQAAGPGGFAEADERRCAALLRERLETALIVSAAGEHLREVSNVFGAPAAVRGAFLLMPAETVDDWAVIAARIGQVPAALAGYQSSLTQGADRGLFAAARQVDTVTGQFEQWLATGGRGWFTDFAESAPANAPDSLRADLDGACSAADAAVADLRAWLLSDYRARTAGTPDAMGPERYQVGVKRWNGASPDLAETYDWGWAQYRQILSEMRIEAELILPGGTLTEAMHHLDSHGEVIDGVDAVRNRLQLLMDEAMANLAGTHFDLSDPIKVVEAKIAPAGSAAAPYYTAPSEDFSRPGRTWLPTLGRTSFPMWELYSTWYHEGVPGHHMQLAQWRYLAAQLSRYQTGLGLVSACVEGWALYAERLMDELGFLHQPGARIGYLDAQLMRAIRVIVDIGMHLELPLAADWAPGAGQRWTPELALEFFAAHSGRPREFAESEIVRYLSMPGQAISYKLGERAWLDGREGARAARVARGASFDLKAWHMAALSLGSLGLDELATELALL